MRRKTNAKANHDTAHRVKRDLPITIVLKPTCASKQDRVSGVANFCQALRQKKNTNSTVINGWKKSQKSQQSKKSKRYMRIQRQYLVFYFTLSPAPARSKRIGKKSFSKMSKCYLAWWSVLVRSNATEFDKLTQKTSLQFPNRFHVRNLASKTRAKQHQKTEYSWELDKHKSPTICWKHLCRTRH